MFEKASGVMRRNGVEIRLNESVSDVSETSFTLQSGEQIGSHTVIWSAGVAPLGGRQAIANVLGIHLTGLVAWFLWRTVYLGIMPGFGRKIRVAMDWTADMFFRRDYSQQSIHVTSDRATERGRVVAGRSVYAVKTSIIS